MNITLTDETLDGNNRVTIQITCHPQIAEWITALISPFLFRPDESQAAHALPDALVQLASHLDRIEHSSGEAHWSKTSSEIISSFIATMNEFQERLSFDWFRWAEKFLDDFWEFFVDVNGETDENIYTLIKGAVEQVKAGAATHSQEQVYLYQSGLPRTFEEWVEEIQGNRIPDEILAAAHFNAIDVKRLREIMRSTKHKKPNDF